MHLMIVAGAAGQLQRGLQVCSLLHRNGIYTVLQVTGLVRTPKVAVLHCREPIDGHACSLL